MAESDRIAIQLMACARACDTVKQVKLAAVATIVAVACDRANGNDFGKRFWFEGHARDPSTG